MRINWLRIVFAVGMCLAALGMGAGIYSINAQAGGLLPAAPQPLEAQGVLATPEVRLPLDSIRSIQDPLPRSGDQPLLVILTDFSDKAGSLGGADWTNFFFGTDGFAAYYEEISGGSLRYLETLGSIVGAEGKLDDAITAYVRLPNPITYYADNQYGYNMEDFPHNDGGVVRDALAKLDAAGFDFSPYADPDTNKVENLVVIYAGANYGYTRDAAGSLEATAFTLTDSGLPGGYTSADGQKFDNYTFCPELYGGGSGIAKIGICAHEHGHALGMFDLYDQGYQTSGVGSYDLMSYGAYGGDYSGSHPFHPSGYTKQFYGWAGVEVAPTGTYTVTLSPAETSTSFLRLYPDGDTSSPEYFVLENRQALGFDADWAGAGLCTGLLIWHIDETITEAYALINLVNSPGYFGGPPHQGVIVVEADGNYDLIKPPRTFGECSDTWEVGRTWNDNTTPNATLWDGSPSNLSVHVLEERPDGSLVLSLRVGAVVYDKIAFLPLVSK
jgi:immune inhibitor A